MYIHITISQYRKSRGERENCVIYVAQATKTSSSYGKCLMCCLDFFSKFWDGHEVRVELDAVVRDSNQSSKSLSVLPCGCFFFLFSGPLLTLLRNNDNISQNVRKVLIWWRHFGCNVKANDDAVWERGKWVVGWRFPLQFSTLLSKVLQKQKSCTNRTSKAFSQFLIILQDVSTAFPRVA